MGIFLFFLGEALRLTPSGLFRGLLGLFFGGTEGPPPGWPAVAC